LIQKTFQAERELLPFRRYPMARMQQDRGNGAPLFEITFNFVHFHVYEELQHVGGVEVLGSDGVGDTNFTLSVDFSLGGAGSQLTLQMKYNAAELSAEQIEAVGRNYLTILESMTRRPLERYEHQRLLSQEDRHKLLIEWNDTRVAFANDKCVHELFEEQAGRTPNAVALTYSDTQLTYAELNTRANQLAHHLQAVGVGPEVLVGVLMERSLETIVTLLAIFK